MLVGQVDAGFERSGEAHRGASRRSAILPVQVIATRFDRYTMNNRTSRAGPGCSAFLSGSNRVVARNSTSSVPLTLAFRTSHREPTSAFALPRATVGLSASNSPIAPTHLPACARSVETGSNTDGDHEHQQHRQRNGWTMFARKSITTIATYTVTTPHALRACFLLET
jgi:hypothetical protein